MFRFDEGLKVYLHRAPVDFRLSINGLAALVQQAHVGQQQRLDLCQHGQAVLLTSATELGDVDAASLCLSLDVVLPAVSAMNRAAN